jgi:GxxExxY protein
MKKFAGEDYPHSELSNAIISCAIAVHSELRPGLDEKLYERGICIEFADRAIDFSQQEKYPVHYKGHFLGNLIPDLIVDKAVVLDLKVVDQFTDDHMAQMLGYLAITGLEVGLLINFKYAKIQIKRVANIKRKNR